MVIAVPTPSGAHALSALTVDSGDVRDSDAESLAAMIDASDGPDLLVHHRWREILGRDALSRRFYRELERAVDALASTAQGVAPEQPRRDIALVVASRLLFLSFLEAKGWLDGDRSFLRRMFDARCARGGAVHERLLAPLFFGTLNTPVAQRARVARDFGRVPFLNGGLFARTPLEKRYHTLRLDDAAIGDLLVNVLARYQLTAHESSSAWSEAAVDPEMLGRAFESLMASDERRKSGAFYTPPALIARVGADALREGLTRAGLADEVVTTALAGRRVRKRHRASLHAAVRELRILDPACGSGAFLVHLTERLADLLQAGGDERGVGERRRDALTRSIFGVDVNPTAVWLCELRLWLAVVIDAPEDDPYAVAPLPNLDRHIRVGDALAGADFADSWQTETGQHHALVRAPGTLARLRARYARASGPRKRALARTLDREERRTALALADHEVARVAARRRDLLCALRSHDLFSARVLPDAGQRRELESLRAAARTARRNARALRSGASLPFRFPVHFADVGARGGFDVVVGNPPWVRLHQIPADAREALRSRYRAYREAAWTAGAEETGAGRGFAAQIDLASLFVERSLALTKPGGCVALLVPAKLWRSLAGGGVRRVLRDDATVRTIEDWSDARATFDAAVYPSLIVAQRGTVTPAPAIAAGTIIDDRPLSWHIAADLLPFDATDGAPWLVLPREVRDAFDRLSAAGTPLAQSVFGRPRLGVKTGCNEAFVLSATDHRVEPELIRPMIRGEDVRAWAPVRSVAGILWTHDRDDRPLPQLPPGARDRLLPWRRRLEARTDARDLARWWRLFRTESARHDVARVVWCDIGKTPRATVLLPGDPTVPLNSCYVAHAATPDDAFALSAWLNAPLAVAWLAALAEPARGGYRRYLGWTLSRLPLPRDWTQAVRQLAPLGRRARDGDVPDAHTLTQAAVRAFHLSHADVAPLMTWCLR
jgi:methylase of polypeptide subunit release factors